jgi:hypothetical protein
MPNFREILKQKYTDSIKKPKKPIKVKKSKKLKKAIRVNKSKVETFSKEKAFKSQESANDQLREVRRLQRLGADPKVIKIRMDRALAAQKRAAEIKKVLKDSK